MTERANFYDAQTGEPVGIDPDPQAVFVALCQTALERGPAFAVIGTLNPDFAERLRADVGITVFEDELWNVDGGVTADVFGNDPDEWPEIRAALA